MADAYGGALQKCTMGQFLTALEELELITPKQMQSLRRQYPESCADEDSQRLAKALVATKTLTKYQASAIYQGRGKELLVGPYTVLGRLGSGGMGTVFRAVHKQSGTLVAVKIVLSSAKSPESIQRFQREARAAATLEHPNIVRAIEYGESHGQHFFAMEYIDGSDLSTMAKKQRRLPVEQAINYVLQAARGLAYAHSQGIVHRDVKPANLFVDRNGQVKILDMGLARFTDPSAAAEAQADQGLTNTGDVMGTIDYMAPEQAFNMRLADARADIYSLGCTLYRLISGRKLYSGETIVEKILAHREQPIPSLRAGRNDISEALDRVFRCSVAKRPEDRYQTMDDFAADLQRSLTAPESVTAPASPAPVGMPALAPEMLPPVPIGATPISPLASSPQPVATPIPVGPLHLPNGPASSGVHQPPTSLPRPRNSFRTNKANPWPKRSLWGVVGIAALSLAYFALVTFGGPAFDVLNVMPQGQRNVARTDPSKVAQPKPTDVKLEAPIAESITSKPAPPSPSPPSTSTSTSTETPSKLDSSTASASIPPAVPQVTKENQPVVPAPISTSPTNASGGDVQEARKAAIDAGIKWLASVQQPDGSWTCAAGPDRGEKESPNAATALASLILLRAGNTHEQGEYRKQVDGGLRYLLVRQQRTNGNFADDGNMYAQGITTLALCEAYETLKESRFKLAAQRAVNVIVYAQDPKGGGWRYTAREAGDISVTGWQLQALLSAKSNKLAVPDITLAGAKHFLQQIQEDGGAAYRYMIGQPSHASNSAVGLFCSLELGASMNDPAIMEGVKRLSDKGPTNNAYYDYYATLLMQKLGGATWDSWKKRVTEQLTSTQETASSIRGSWKPNKLFLLGKGGGRFAQTTFNILTLQMAEE